MQYETPEELWGDFLRVPNYRRINALTSLAAMNEDARVCIYCIPMNVRRKKA